MTYEDKRILRIYADCDMNLAKTAEWMNYHRNTLKYHMNKIRDETGLDPTCFWDLVTLLENAGVYEAIDRDDLQRIAINELKGFSDRVMKAVEALTMERSGKARIKGERNG